MVCFLDKNVPKYHGNLKLGMNSGCITSKYAKKFQNEPTFVTMATVRNVIFFTKLVNFELLVLGYNLET